MGDNDFGGDPAGMATPEFLKRTIAATPKAAALTVFGDASEAALDLTLLVKSAPASDALADHPLPLPFANEMRRVGAGLLGLVKRGDAPEGYRWDETAGAFMPEDGTVPLSKAEASAAEPLSKESKERLDADLGQMSERLMALRKAIQESPEGDNALVSPVIANELHALGRGLGLALQRTPGSTSAGFLTLPAAPNLTALAKAAQGLTLHPSQRDAIGARLDRVAERLSVTLRDVERMQERPDTLAPEQNGLPIFTAKSAVECGNELLALAKEFGTLSAMQSTTEPQPEATPTAPTSEVPVAKTDPAPAAPADGGASNITPPAPAAAAAPAMPAAAELAALVKSAVEEATAPLAAELKKTQQALEATDKKVGEIARTAPPLAAVQPGGIPVAKAEPQGDPAVVGCGSFSAAEVQRMKRDGEWVD